MSEPSSFVVQWWLTRDQQAVLPEVAPDWQPLRELLEAAAASVEQAFAAMPGTLVFPDEPIVQLRLATDAPALRQHIDAWLSESLAATQRQADQCVQVYRQVNEQGQLAQDLLQSIDADPVPGLVLLQAVWSAGRWIGPTVSETQRAATATLQRQALGDHRHTIPIVRG